jgi:uncharacterized protein YecT (DUF1311 family)
MSELQNLIQLTTTVYLLVIVTACSKSEQPQISDTPSNDQKIEYSQEPNYCSNPQFQSQMNSCAEFWAKAEEAKLNQIHQQLASKMEDSRREKLVETELAWVKSRDSACNSEAKEVEGGTIWPTIYYSCITEKTKQHRQELEKYINSDNQ